MHRRLHAQLAALTAALLAGGCVQMTRHSNMMIFGTNTVVGIRAGVNATSVPEVAIGYARQEAVVLPLVANTASADPDGSGLNRLIPCNLTTTPAQPLPGNAKFAVHPCSLVGFNGTALDSYSVLASFGGAFSATTADGAPQGQAGVAQYFATGLAAQTLALNGGAAVVAAGKAADQAAAKQPMTLTGVTRFTAGGAGDVASPVLVKYFTVADPAEAGRRWTLAQGVATKLGLSSNRGDIATLVASGSNDDRQNLLAGLRVADTTPDGSAALKAQ